MGYNEARLPELPASFVNRWLRAQQGNGGILTKGASGSILGGSNPLSDDEQRRRKFQIYWDFWKSPEYAAIHDAHRQEAEERRRQYEEREGSG